MKVYNSALHTSCYSKANTEVVKKKSKSIKKLIKNSVKWKRWQGRSPLQMLFTRKIANNRPFLNLAELSARVQECKVRTSQKKACVQLFSVLSWQSLQVNPSEYLAAVSQHIFVSACSYFYLFLYFLESVFDFILLWFLIGLQLLINHVKFWENLILRVIFNVHPPPPSWHQCNY